MSLAFKQFTVYLRTVLIVLVAGAIGLVLWNNRANEVSFWFFGVTGTDQPVNVIWLIVCTAVGTLVSWWVFSFGWGLWRDMREVKRTRAAELAEEELARREAALDDRDRRIDQKLRQAIDDDENAETQ